MGQHDGSMIPVVLSGGSGTRLWPRSNANLPKQFSSLLGEPLQERTLKRVLPLGRPWTLSTEKLREHSIKLLTRLELPVELGIYEPYGRNTAPAIALLCRIFQLQHLDAEVVGIFPADHLIKDEKTFLNAARLAESCAQQGKIVTFGIVPSYPATGYGYIESSGASIQKKDDLEVLKAIQFHEKPDLERAKEFLGDNRHFWNAGIFIFRVSTMIEHFKNLLPELWGPISEIKSDLSGIAHAYDQVKPISIDYGIMEKLDDIYVIPTNMGWSDVGSWDEMAKIDTNPARENTQVFEINSKNNYLNSTSGKTYALIGVEDLIIVDSAEGLLVCKKDQSENVKNIVEEIEKRASN